MTAHSVAQLLATLGVTKSHSRPYVSNDNPFSEAQFKTLKYQPTFPECFGSMEDARAWAQPFCCLLRGLPNSRPAWETLTEAAQELLLFSPR